MELGGVFVGGDVEEVEVGEETTDCFGGGSALELRLDDPVHRAGGVG